MIYSEAETNLSFVWNLKGTLVPTEILKTIEKLKASQSITPKLITK